MKRQRSRPKISIKIRLIADLQSLVGQYFGVRCVVSFPNDEDLEPLECWMTCAWPNFYECDFDRPFPHEHEDFVFRDCQLPDFRLHSNYRFTVHNRTKEIICVWGSTVDTEYEKLCGYQISPSCFRFSRSALGKMYQSCDVSNEFCEWKAYRDGGHRVEEWAIIYGLPVNACSRHSLQFYKLCIECAKWVFYTSFEHQTKRKLLLKEKDVFHDSVNPQNGIWICHICIKRFTSLRHLKLDLGLRKTYGNSLAPLLLQMKEQ